MQKLLKVIVQNAMVDGTDDGVTVAELKTKPTLTKACTDLFAKVGMWSAPGKKVPDAAFVKELEELLAESYIQREFADSRSERLAESDEFRRRIARQIVDSFNSKTRQPFAGEARVYPAVEYGAIGRAQQLVLFKKVAAADLAISDIYAAWIASTDVSAEKNAWAQKAAASERCVSDAQLSDSFWKSFFKKLHKRAPTMDSEASQAALVAAYYRAD